MEIILLQDVKSLGKKGERVKINDGYARNFVLPKKLGIEATAKNLNDLKLQNANEDRIACEKQLGLEIDKKKMVLPEPIKACGTTIVPVKLHREVTAKLTVKVQEA